MNVEIGQISGGAQIIGPNGTIHQYGAAGDRLTEAVAALFAALTEHRGELSDPERARTAALAVRDEASAPHPARTRILALLHDLTLAAGGAGAVVAAVQAVTEVAQHLP